jgi:hypothetical protein
MGYKILGYAVWRGAKWFLRRKAGQVMPSRRLVSAGVVGLAVTGIAVAAARRSGSDD